MILSREPNSIIWRMSSCGYNDDRDARGKTTIPKNKRAWGFWTRKKQNIELRTLHARENCFEHDYYVLSGEFRQNQLAETNERTLVM